MSNRRRPTENPIALDSVRSVVRVEVARLSPDELLVIRMPPGTKGEIIDAINAACADSKFHGRVLVIAAEAQMTIVNSVDPAPQIADLSNARVTPIGGVPDRIGDARDR